MKTKAFQRVRLQPCQTWHNAERMVVGVASGNEEKIPKPKYNMWQNTGYMISLAWKEKEKKVIVLCLLSAAFAVLNNLVNLYIAPAVLAAVERKAPVSELLFTTAFFIGAMMLCSAASAYINTNTMYGRVSVRGAIASAINIKAATTSFPNLWDKVFLRLSAKASEAVCSNSAAGEAIWNTLTMLTQNVIGFLIYLILLASVQPVLMLLILTASMTGYFVSTRLNGYEYRHREEIAEYERKMWYIGERAKDYSTAKDIRIFGIRPWLEELAAKAMEAYMAFHRRVQGVYIWARIADLFLAFLRNGAAYFYLLRLVLSGGLSAAQFLLYFSAVSGFTAWVSGIMGNLSELHRQSLDISTAREFLEYPEAFRFEEGESLEPDQQCRYEICLDDISFRYPGAAKDTLSHISLTLHPGEKLAVVGLNGAGKTTLIKLLCGFLDPTGGRVLLNGRDIRDYNRRDYYRMFSAVFQDFSLIAGTVAMNVAQTEKDIDMQRVKKCIEDAGLKSKMESLENQYETLLNREVYEEAVMLSGGETQRLMLARALYKDAPFIILDEPTAALDPVAEADIYQKYNEMVLGKSSIYISHRLASTRFCDRIIFLENAGIAEEGTHESLMQKKGRYAELFAVQSQYYQEGGNGNEE